MALLAIAIFATASLVSGADYLLQPVGPFPLGNLLTTAGLASLPLAAWLYAGDRRWLNWLCLFAVVLAVCWYPASAALAGNLNLEFSGQRGGYWVMLTLASAVLSVMTPVVVLGVTVVDRLRRA
ncbi:MAG: hypothetical protein AAGF72_00325 [Pseudomonadota bacterium]